MLRTPSTTQPSDLRALHGTNVRRLMARLDMTLQDVAAATGLDQRTLRSILRGVSCPHARTLHKLAEGLGVSTNELFQNPHQGDPCSFDRATNPIVAEVIEAHPELFARWSQSDFDELFSHMAVGGELTHEGVFAAAKALNARRDLMYKAAVILESSDADLLRDLITTLFRRVTVSE